MNKIIKIKIKEKSYSGKEAFAFFACAFMILWQPLFAYYLHVDGRAAFAKSMLLIAFLINLKPISKISFDKPYRIYWILAIYMMINGLLKHGYLAYDKDGIYQLCCAALVAPLLMAVLTPLFVKHFDKTLRYMTYTLWIYSIMFFFNTSYIEKGDVMRFTGEINANEAALYIVTCFLCHILMFVRKKWSFRKLIILSIPLLYVILLTASRMAIIMCFIIIVGTLVLYLDPRKRRNRIKLISLVLVLGLLSFYVMNNTLVGERLSGTSSTLEETNMETGTILDELGDRGVAYYNSWPYFLQYPITGIGFQNWRLVNPLELRAHSEYMVMYVENGLIALILYVWFFILIIKRVLRYKKENNKEVISFMTSGVLLSAIFSILYADIVLWTHNEYSVFVVYAMCYAISFKYLKKKNSKIIRQYGNKK